MTRVRLFVLMTAVYGLAACGSSGSGPSTPSGPPPLTQAQIMTLEDAFASVENTIAPQIFPQVFAIAMNATGNVVPLSVSAPCADGGTVGITGTVTGMPSSNTKAVMSTNVTIAFSKCMAKGVELDGSLPSVGQMNVDLRTPNVVVNPTTFTISGTSSFSLGGVTGTTMFACSNSLTVDLNAKTDNLVTTGNATLQYPTGQNTVVVPCSGFSDGFNGSIFPKGKPSDVR
jgi:hypothetical protein